MVSIVDLVQRLLPLGQLSQLEALVGALAVVAVGPLVVASGDQPDPHSGALREVPSSGHLSQQHGERDSVDALRRLCSPIWGELPADCLPSLEQRYIDRPIDMNVHSTVFGIGDPSLRRIRRWRPLPAVDVIVWRDLFADPLGLRESVLDALGDPRCRVLAGEPRFHLRDTCAAGAMARLAELQAACGAIRVRDHSPEHHVVIGTDDEVIGRSWAAEWSAEYQLLESEAAVPDEYWRRRRVLEESELHFLWRLVRCRAVPDSTFAWLPELLPAYFGWEQDQSKHLRTLALRLGSVWAILRDVAGPAELNALASFDVALTYQQRAASLKTDGEHEPTSAELAYLVAAYEFDSRRPQPIIEWRGFLEAYSETVLDTARRHAKAILAEGWRPVQEHVVTPDIVRSVLVRQRVDHDGHVRRMYDDGSESWFDGRRTRTLRPDGTEALTITSRTRQSDRTQPPLRVWLGEDGRRRWLDIDGVEHWTTSDGAEHWIESDGTKWTLLPLRSED